MTDRELKKQLKNLTALKKAIPVKHLSESMSSGECVLVK